MANNDEQLMIQNPNLPELPPEHRMNLDSHLGIVTRQMEMLTPEGETTIVQQELYKPGSPNTVMVGAMGNPTLANMGEGSENFSPQTTRKLANKGENKQDVAKAEELYKVRSKEDLDALNDGMENVVIVAPNVTW